MNPLQDFAKNSLRLVKRCTKPDRKGGPNVAVEAANAVVARAAGVAWGEEPVQAELTGAACLWCAEFEQICWRTGAGFVVMGFIGFFVKLIFIVSALWPGAWFPPVTDARACRVTPPACGLQPINQIIVGGS